MNNKSISVLVSIGVAVLAACGTQTEDGTSTVLIQTVTQTVDTRPAPTGDATPNIATGSTNPTATTTPPLITGPELAPTTTMTTAVTTTDTTPEPDDSAPTLTSEP
jgi:hypothetical protein